MKIRKVSMAVLGGCVISIAAAAYWWTIFSDQVEEIDALSLRLEQLQRQVSNIIQVIQASEEQSPPVLPSPVATTAESTQIQALQQQVEALRMAVENYQENDSRPLYRQERSVQGDDFTQVLSSQDPTQALQQSLEEDRALLARLESRHWGDSYGSTLTGAVEQQLITTFAQSDLQINAELSGVDCRSTLCAVDLQFRNTRDFIASDQAIIEWLMRSSATCGFFVPSPEFPEAQNMQTNQRIYIDCESH